MVTLINPMEITTPARDWSNSVVTHQLEWDEQFPTFPHYDVNQITLRIQTTDYSLLLDADGNYQDEVVWYLAVNRVSTKSDVDNSASRVYFKLTLADVCHDLPLTASEPRGALSNQVETVYLFDLWQFSHSRYRISSSASGWPSVYDYCGDGFTHYMMYESLTQGVIPSGVSVMQRGEVYASNEIETLFGVPTNGANFDGPSGAGILLTDLHWVGEHNRDLVGTHVFYIRSYIGRVPGGTTSTRQGMYPSNYIDSTYTITLNVKNPCNEAQLTIPTLTKNVDNT